MTVAEHEAVYRAIAAHDPARRARRDGRASHRRRGASWSGGDAAEKELVRRERQEPSHEQAARAAPLTAPLIHADRLFPTDFATRDARARAVRDGARPADRLAARPHRSAVVRRQRAVPRSARALFVTPDHYVFRMLYSQGVPLEELGIPRKGRRSAGRDRRAQDLAHVRRALSPVPRHADAAVARPRVLHGVRHDERLSAADRRPLFRPHHANASPRRRSARARCSSGSTSR